MSDIFVAFPPSTENNCVIFAKNSHRPPTEVQEIVYFPGKTYNAGSKLKCTYIEVDQADKTYDVFLSKPTWCWGAEMGSNQNGVCVGCTSVWTKLCNPGDHEGKLLGVDFVRLALERSKTAKEALDVITSLLDQYGQGGKTCDDDKFGQWSYNNAFAMADSKEGWILNTAGKYWAAKKISSGAHNVSSILSLESDFDLSSPGLEKEAEAGGYWKSDMGKFNFSQAFSSEYSGLSLPEKQMPSCRLKAGQQLLQQYNGKLSLAILMSILRDEENGINLCGELSTTGSQISILPDSNIPNSHWMTGTPNAAISCFKPFFFTPNARIGNSTVCCDGEKRHPLYIHHEMNKQRLENGRSGSSNENELYRTLQDLEQQCIDDVNSALQNFSKDMYDELSDLFKDIAETEVKFYR